LESENKASEKMNKPLKTAVLTTLKQLPVIFWQFAFIAVHDDADQVNYLLPVNIMVFATMIGLTFWLAYKTDRINQHPWWVYSLVFIAPASLVAFHGAMLAQMGLFVLSLLLYGLPWKK